MPSLSDTLLRATTLTEAVNEIKAPNSFIRNLVFGRRVPVPTEFIEFSLRTRSRRIAPFVKKNGSAVMIDTHQDSFRVAEPPHIRIKRPMDPSDLVKMRRAGFGIHMTRADQNRMIRDHVAQEIRNLSLDADESEEWLCAMALRGSVTYEDSAGDAFEITYPRSADHDVSLAAGTTEWDGGSAVNIRKDFMTAAEAIHDKTGINPSVVVLGRNAADAFVDNPEVQSILDNRRIDIGELRARAQFQEDGAMFLGTFFNNIQVWRYGRSVETDEAGTSEQLIRDDYAEFLALGPQAEHTLYYGAIQDADALGEGTVLPRARFSKSWIKKDPSQRIVLLASNPLPVLRRPDTTYSLRVVVP